MTWLAPWALAAGSLGMLGVLAAHLLSRQRPRALALATARFLPSGMLEATTLQAIPTGPLVVGATAAGDRAVGDWRRTTGVHWPTPVSAHRAVARPFTPG